MPKCILTPNPGDITCDFQASSLVEVTLEVKSTVGIVAIDSASTYSGSAITFVSATQIKFTVVSGRTTLTLAYDFTDTTNGAGTLNEVCDANTFLDNLRSSLTPVAYV